MDAIPHHGDPRHAGRDTNEDGKLHVDMEATVQALLSADNAHVREAMNSVEWERRGLLQRLTRRAR
jgi:hypothetical protein